MPGGGKGYALAEESPGYRRTYRYWPQRPEYKEVRALVLQALADKLKPQEQVAADNAEKFTSEALPVRIVAQQPQLPPPPSRALSEEEQALTEQVKALGLAPGPTSILVIGGVAAGD